MESIGGILIDNNLQNLCRDSLIFFLTRRRCLVCEKINFDGEKK